MRDKARPRGRATAGVDPAALRRQVTSPNGTTQAALDVLMSAPGLRDGTSAPAESGRAVKLPLATDPPLLDFVRRLTERHEGRRPAPWSVEDAPIDYIEAARRGIVGVELVVTALEGKAKLSQNRSSADRDGVRRGLAHGTERDREVGARMNADEGAPDPS